MQSVLNLDESEAEQLLSAIGQLSSHDGSDPTITFDLGPRSWVRARDTPESEVIQVPLPKSHVTGPELVAVATVPHVRRALEMGLRRFRFTGAERPWVATDDSRTYISAVLDPTCAIRAESTSETSKALVPLSNRLSSPFKENAMPHPSTNGHLENGQHEESMDFVGEAEALKLALAEAHARAGRLVAGLRGYRKERRTVENALASLRSLRLQ